MKILFTCNALGVGGSERNVLLHARELARTGHEVRIHPLVHGGEMEALASAWLHPERSGGRDAAEIERKMEAHIRDWKPDVVHDRVPGGVRDGVGVLAGAGAGVGDGGAGQESV